MWFCINLEYFVVSYWILKYIGYYVNCICIYILVRVYELDLFKIFRIKICICFEFIILKKNFVYILGIVGLVVYFVNGICELLVIVLYVFY